MIGKIINGVFSEPTERERAKIIIANPTDEMLKFIMGYKDVSEEEKPEYDEETEVLSPIYTENEDNITVSWKIKKLETEE